MLGYIILLTFVIVVLIAYSKKYKDFPEDVVFTTNYRLEVPYINEKPVKITKLLMYPVRGIKGVEVDHVKVSSEGIKWDRDWAIYKKSDKRVVSQTESVELTHLRQRIEKTNGKKELIIYLEKPEEFGMQGELRIDMKRMPDGDAVDLMDNRKGIPEGKQYDEWLSKFLNKEVMLMRAPQNYLRGLEKGYMIQQNEEVDKIKGFLCDAALHTVNESSVRDLRQRVLAKYLTKEEKEKISVDAENFRANIFIDTETPYDEDGYQEMRCDNVMMRLVGYCKRCNAVTNNQQTHQRNLEYEPNRTLNFYRKNEIGILFGVYHQVNIIQSEEQFERLLPYYPIKLNKPFDKKWGIIRNNDELRIRLFEKRISFKPEK